MTPTKVALPLSLVLACTLALAAPPALAQSATAAPAASQVAKDVRLVMLGTMAGPMATADRAQPATLLQWTGGAILVDAGDGVVDQMAKAHVDPVKVRTIVITHIHADHVGGLFALLTRRYQLMDPPVTIYGPPGSRQLVAGLVAAMEPLRLTSPAVPGVPARPPGDMVKVIEVADGAKVDIDGVAVRTVANTHYLSGADAPDPALAQSLSLRFEFPGRVVVMTGDTGPSPAVTALAKGADVLVSSILDLDGAVAAIRASRPNAPEAFFAAARAHFSQHHLSPEAVGLLARDAGVKRLVLSHIGITPPRLAAAGAAISASYTGPVDFARDLDVF